MRDSDRTKQQLTDELAELRRRIGDLERLQAQLRRAEEALRKSEEHHSALVANLTDAVFTIKGGLVTWCNDRVEAIYSYPKEELLGKTAGFFYPSDVSPRRFTEMVSAAIREHGFFRGTSKFRRKDGTWADIEYSLSQIPGKEPVEVIAVARDVTERRRAEEALRQSEQYYRSLIENALEVIIVIGEDGAIKYLSPAVATVLGYKPEEVLGADSLSFIHPDDLPGVAEQFGQMLQNPGAVMSAVVRARHKDGSWRVMEAVGHNLLGEPAVAGIVVNYRDITERKKAAEALRESEVRFQTVFEGAAIGMAVVGRDGKPLEVNPSLHQMLGYTPEDFASLKPSDYLHPEDALMDADLFTEMTRGKRDHYQVDKRYIRKDGAVVWGRQTLSLVRSGEGKPLFTIAMVEDVTEKKRVHEQLREGFARLRRMLDQTVTAVASVVELRDRYTAGHQIRVAALASAIAREMGLPSERVEGIRMAGLVHDVGKISIPAEILSKPGLLTQIERTLVRGHSHASHEILSGIEFPWPVRDIVLQHHERIDGSGYPKGLSGEGIMLEARIMAVADVVEAMSSHRPYRPALGRDAALAEITFNRGVLYDPDVVDTCVKLFNEKGFEF